MSAVPANVNKVGRFRLLGWTFVLTGMGLVGLGLAALLVAVVALILVWVGVPLTLWTLTWMHDFANWHRRCFARLVGVEIPRPYLPVPEDGWLGRLKAANRDPANWRDAAWLLVNGIVGKTLPMFSCCLFLGGVFYLLLPAIWPLAPGVFNGNWGLFTMHDQASSFLAMPFGAAGLLLWWWLTPALVRADAWLARWLLPPTERSKLAGRVEHLTASRADTVDAQAAELRRIERDLHDGAQARLVGLGMSLGMADEMLETNPADARRLLGEARDATGAALTELRDLARGIHPPVLADRGLDGAIQALVLAVPIPVALSVDLPPEGLPPPVESAAYFAVAEVLANLVKHSEAGTGWIRIEYLDGSLSMVVGDNGKGGADPERGTGLRGIERRLGAFDGTLEVSSPPGGPTVVVMEVPCEPSSLKTSPS
ncbi:MAG TPA: sensor domain-containing protein [Acidimicrobiales bacterium]|nr:sensor domain-containing protein [Acidimicrobiales bacterium]